jgi:hypothetical protein
MANVRMLPPIQAGAQARSVNGRSYAGAPGSAQDVPEQDAGHLEANGWIRVAYSGPTIARPTSMLGVNAIQRGGWFFDTTLNAMIVHDGATWRSPINGAAV